MIIKGTNKIIVLYFIVILLCVLVNSKSLTCSKPGFCGFNICTAWWTLYDKSNI